MFRAHPLRRLVVLLVSFTLVLTSVELLPAAAEEEEPIAVEDLPALDSGPVPELEPEVPEGDFSNRPVPPGAPADQVEAAHEALGDGESFDPEHSEVLEEATSPTQEVFENEDGSFTAEVSSVPVRFEDEEGAWVDIDLTLEESADGTPRWWPRPTSSCCPRRNRVPSSSRSRRGRSPSLPPMCSTASRPVLR